jgi:hypothetical protein
LSGEKKNIKIQEEKKQTQPKTTTTQSNTINEDILIQPGEWEDF